MRAFLHDAESAPAGIGGEAHLGFEVYDSRVAEDGLHPQVVHGEVEAGAVAGIAAEAIDTGHEADHGGVGDFEEHPVVDRHGELRVLAGRPEFHGAVGEGVVVGVAHEDFDDRRVCGSLVLAVLVFVPSGQHRGIEGHRHAAPIEA